MKLFKIFFALLVSINFYSYSYAASMSMIGEKGDPNKFDRIINVKMYDNYYEPNKIMIKKL